MTDTIKTWQDRMAQAGYAEAFLRPRSFMQEEIDELRAALAQQAEQASCEWKQDPDYELGDTYHSSCGELWSFVDGGPKENRVSYCHHCGKPVKMAAAPKGRV